MKKIIMLFTTALILASTIALANTVQLADRGGSPPGLSGKGGGDFPKGLEKREKTPSGWSHGEKRGWDHHYKHHHHHHYDMFENDDHDR